ncbi:unnamed protein product [Closterium sp. NIES-65]|nr:unnamed protein product [Closterium sp. NIES-65]
MSSLPNALLPPATPFIFLSPLCITPSIHVSTHGAIRPASSFSLSSLHPSSPSPLSATGQPPFPSHLHSPPNFLRSTVSIPTLHPSSPFPHPNYPLSLFCPSPFFPPWPRFHTAGFSLVTSLPAILPAFPLPSLVYTLLPPLAPCALSRSYLHAPPLALSCYAVDCPLAPKSPSPNYHSLFQTPSAPSPPSVPSPLPVLIPLANTAPYASAPLHLSAQSLQSATLGAAAPLLGVGLSALTSLTPHPALLPPPPSFSQPPALSPPVTNATPEPLLPLFGSQPSIPSKPSLPSLPSLDPLHSPPSLPSLLSTICCPCPTVVLQSVLSPIPRSFISVLVVPPRYPVPTLATPSMLVALPHPFKPVYHSLLPLV